MITSKLTTKAQTTIPQPVRVALRLEAPAEGRERGHDAVARGVPSFREHRDAQAEDPNQKGPARGPGRAKISLRG